MSERPSLPRCLIATACVPVPLGVLFPPISLLKLVSNPDFPQYFHCFLRQVLTRPSVLSFPSNSGQHASCSGSSPEYRHESIGEACEPRSCIGFQPAEEQSGRANNKRAGKPLCSAHLAAHASWDLERPRVPLRESAFRSLSLASDPKHRDQKGGSEERKVLEVFEEGPMEASCRLHITATR